MIRGGSWNNNAQNARCAYRNANEPGNRNNNLGFRCARIQPAMDVALEQMAILSGKQLLAKTKWPPVC